MNLLKDLFPSLTPIIGFISCIGATIVALLGGWDNIIIILIIFMIIDYISGLIVAIVFKKSTKSANGALESNAGFKGLCRKAMILLMIIIAAQFDKLLGIDWVRESIIIAFIVNESISIIENAGLMGLPIPQGLKKQSIFFPINPMIQKKAIALNSSKVVSPKISSIFSTKIIFCVYILMIFPLIYVMRSDKYQ